MYSIDQNFILKIFKKRATDSNKGNHGHALIIAGSTSKMGAAIISSKACLRAGAGLVTLHIPKSERLAIFTSIPEAMIEFAEEKNNWDKYHVFAIGPGIGTHAEAKNKVKLVIQNVKKPIVFDADALNILANNKEWLAQIPEKSIITPHAKEFDRLFEDAISDSERRQKAVTKAVELKCIIVLKGHPTFITDGYQSYENITGNSGLAKGGSGDALTGIITAFLAQGYESLNAALLGVYLHGLAADITLATQSEESMLITDVIQNIGSAFKKIQNKI
jgi:hydroxyethylthiazole kinase-like uncharacterized protein yjeF